MSEQLTAKEKEALRAYAYEDPVFFCRHFLPHIFRGEIPWVHRGILAILTRKCAFLERYGEIDKIVKNFVARRADGTFEPFFEVRDGHVMLRVHRFTCTMMPRGFSKTMLCGLAIPLYDILYKEHKFIVYVSETAAHAEMQLANIKRELESNYQIQLLFGTQKPDRASSAKWTQDFVETTGGVALAAKGRGAQIRGLNHLGHRPSKIICDDLEDKESVSTDLQRKKTREWAYGDLMPALQEDDPEATIVALGTLLHPEALLNVWAEDLDWTTVKIAAVDTDGASVWPYLWPLSKLEAKKQAFSRVGQLHTFYMEYMNESRASELEIFKRDWFSYVSPAPSEQLFFGIYSDPAISEKRTADHATIAVNAITPSGHIYTFESWGKIGASPREQVDKFFEFVLMYRIHERGRAGVESNAFQAALLHLMYEEMARRGVWFELVGVHNKAKKASRIQGILQPRYAARYIRHTRVFAELETQLLEFHPERDGKDDFADAQAGCITLLDPYAGVVAETAPLAPLRKLNQEDYLHY